MYFAIIQQFIKTLKNLDGILHKAQQRAEEKKFDPSNFCGLRFAPDMFTLARQVQISCDTAKTAAALLSNKAPPKHEDSEKTLVELRGRVHTVVAYLETFHQDDYKALQPTSVIKLTNPPNKSMHAQDAVLSRFIPNFFFHIATAYDLLRANGVEIGKGDYLGQLNFFDS